MKLSNKKTGTIGYIEYVMRTINPKTGDPLLTVRYKDSKGITCYIDYKTIAEFNDNWEDYKPAAPLIKDKKIRKAVLAWAVANDFDHLIYFSKSDKDYFSFMDGKTEYEIMFDKYDEIKWLKNDRNYTIAELCGEKK